MPSIRNGSTSAGRRRGIAAKEILLVTAVIGGAAVGLWFLDPDNNHTRDPVRAGELVTLLQREVPLGDEFVCFVSVAECSRPGSPRSPYYLSRVRFSRRHPHASDLFVLEFVGDATPGWHKMGTCRAWSLMAPDAALDYLHEQGRTPVAPSELTETERESALIACLSSAVQDVRSLDEPLWHCVPEAFKDSGIVLITDEEGLQYLQNLQGFPLSTLASAIRTAAQDDNWTTDDPTARLTQKNMGNSALTDDDEQAIAQAFVYRLLDYLSQDEAEDSDAGIDGGQGTSGNRPR